MSETEIIEKIIRKELTGEYTTKFTKTDLQRVTDYLTAQNFQKARQEMGITGYIKYILRLKANSGKQKDILLNNKYTGYVYEK